MSLQFVDGCDSYGVDGDIDRKYNEVKGGSNKTLPIYRKTGGRFGGGAIEVTTTDGHLLKVVDKAQELIFGWSMNLTGFGAAAQFIARTGFAGDGHIGVKTNPDGTLQVARDDTLNGNWSGGGTTILGASDEALFTDTWHFVQVRVLHSKTAGEVQVWIDEEEWVNLTGIDTVGDTADTELANDVIIGFNSVGNAEQHHIDDLYIISVDGQGQHNSRLGDIRIETLHPSADTTQADFTPKSGGDNYEEVDDADLDLDTSYNFSDVKGARDLYQFEDIADTPDQIFAVVASIVARKETAGTRRLASVLDSNGSEKLGGVLHPDRVLTQEYLYRQFINPLDPDGDVAWTVAAVDALEAGYEIAE